MRINEFVEKDKIKLEGTWEKFDEDFRKAISNVHDTEKLLNFIKVNKKLLDKYKEVNEQGWEKLRSYVWDQAFGKFSNGKSTWAVPETLEEAETVIDYIRNGIKVEEAAEKLQDIMGYRALYEAIAQAEIEIPHTNFADTLANFIVNLNPKNDAIKKMQDEIIHDPDLACLISKPIQIKESKEKLQDIYAKALHEDLQFLKDLGKLNEEEANKKAFIRAIQFGTSTKNILNRYIQVYEEKNLYNIRPPVKAAFGIMRELKESKKLGEVSKSQKAEIILKHAIKNNTDFNSVIKAYKNIFLEKFMAHREPPKQFGKKIGQSNICFNCDGTGSVHGALSRECPFCHGKGHSPKLGEEVIPFAKPKKIKHSHLDYITGVIKQIIDKDLKLGKIKTEKDAEELEKALLDKVAENYVVNDIHDWNNVAVQFDTTFKDRFGQNIYRYMCSKAGLDSVREDIIPFPGNKNPKVIQHKKASIVKMPKADSLHKATILAKKFKELADKTDLASMHDRQRLYVNLDHTLVDEDVNHQDFYNAFDTLYGEDFGLYVLQKAEEDKAKYAENYESIDFDDFLILTEGMDTNTAHRTRQAIAKILRSLVDSSDIHLLSNFESYEDQQHLSLKINVYQNNEKKLQTVLSKLIHRIEQEGFEPIGENSKKFVKGDTVLRFTPIRKTFRTGPYKNREVVSFGIEVLGPKRAIKVKNPIDI